MHLFEWSKEELRHIAAQDFESALGGMKIENLIPWEDIGIEPVGHLDGKTFAALGHDERRAVIDKIHDIAMLPVYEGNTPGQRDEAHKSIDEGVRTAKWRYTLSLVNDAYDLGYDYVDMEIMAPLCAQLATIERGATNPHMPTTHKLRHNPAVHSMHVAGLVNDIFAQVEQDNPDISAGDGDTLHEMRRQLMRAALVHDMGELKGELSVASSRSGMTPEQMEAFEHRRGLTETEVFENALTERSEALTKVRWPKEMLHDRKDALLNDYSNAEESGVFLGRLHKLIERMQSQQDYLRFEGKDMAPPLKTVPQGQGYHKDFMLGYALEPMEGLANGVKNKPALAELAEQFENPQLAGRIVKTAQERLDALQKTIADRLEYRPRSFAERFTEGVRISGGIQR